MTDSKKIVIPVSKVLINHIFVKHQSLAESLTSEQLSALIFLDSASQILKGIDEPEILEKTYTHALSQIQTKIKPLPHSDYQQIINTLDEQRVLSNVVWLQQKKVAFLEEIESGVSQVMVDKSFSSLLGKSVHYNAEQHRLLSMVRGGFDGNIDVQGVAGSGKTTMMLGMARQLRETSPNAVIVWITRSQYLKEILYKELGSQVVIAMTYLEFCEGLSSPVNLWGAAYNKKIDDQKLAELIGIYDQTDCYQGTGQVVISALDTFRLVKATVDNFCYSSRRQLVESQVPPTHFGQTDLILNLAERYWNLIISQHLTDVPVEPQHHAKFIQLNLRDMRLQQRVSFLLVDEAQEIPPSIMFIINNITGKYLKYRPLHVTNSIILGDKFQALGHFNDWVYATKRTSEEEYSRADDVKVLSDSERFGQRISSIASSILLSSGYNHDTAAFNGINSHQDNVIYFDWRKVDVSQYANQKPTVFLAHELWSVLELMLRFCAKNIALYVPYETRAELEKLVSAAFELIQKQKIYHAEFSQFKTWQQYISVKNSALLERIDGLFNKGFNSQALAVTLKKVSQRTAHQHIITLVEHFKGAESARVALLPGAESQLKQRNLKESQRFRIAHKFYTGITRTTETLILPKSFEDGLF